jgi:hypothetical protein
VLLCAGAKSRPAARLKGRARLPHGLAGSPGKRVDEEDFAFWANVSAEPCLRCDHDLTPPIRFKLVLAGASPWKLASDRSRLGAPWTLAINRFDTCNPVACRFRKIRSLALPSRFVLTLWGLSGRWPTCCLDENLPRCVVGGIHSGRRLLPRWQPNQEWHRIPRQRVSSQASRCKNDCILP